MPWLAYVVDGIFIALWSFEFPVLGLIFLSMLISTKVKGNLLPKARSGSNLHMARGPLGLFSGLVLLYCPGEFGAIVKYSRSPQSTKR